MKIFNIFFLIFISLASVAQKVTVSAKTDRTQVSLNGFFTFTITIQYEGRKPKNLQMPHVSELTNFVVLDQWSGSQSSVSIVNGRMEKTQSLAYNYRLQAQKKGTLKIKSLEVKVNGKVYKTEPIMMVVTKKQNQAPPSSSPRSLFPKNFSGIDPFFDSFFNNTNIFPEPLNAKQSVKLKVDLSKKTAYVGEAVKANWILLVSSGNVHYEIQKNPKLQGFWKEGVASNPHGQFLGTSIIDNVLYRKTLVDSMILFPLRRGKLKVDSYVLKVRSVFGFNSRSKNKTTPSQIITVKPLPLAGKKNFTGAVGTFKVTASLKEKKGKVNEPLSYTVKFEGDGHPQFIKLPKIPFPDTVKTYNPVEKSKFNSNGKNFKNYEIIFIPKVQGQIVIPAFQVSTFDPKQGVYIYHQIPSFQIKVGQGNQKVEEELHFFDNEKQTSEGTDELQPLQPMVWPFFLNHKFLMRCWLFFYTSLSLLFLLLVLWPLRHRKKTVKEKLKNGLRQVESLIGNKKWKPSSVKLISLVYLVLYQFDTKNISTDWLELVKKLPPSLYEKYGLSLIQIMRSLEKLSFAQKTLSDEQALEKVKDLYQRTEKLLVELLYTSGRKNL